jgi:hypothetical protein
MARIACELVDATHGPPVAAPPGHTLDDCYDAAYWSALVGRELVLAGP